MVIAGVLQTIPNLWEDVEYGEKIFIFAESMDKEYYEDLDMSKALHRKVYNESFIGNIPKTLCHYPTQTYLGYVRVYHTGIIQEGWVKNCEQTLFVTSPHRFSTRMDNYEADFKTLDSLQSNLVNTKVIERKDDELFVPVGKEVWAQLKTPEEWRGLCLFWEEYMKSFANTLFSMELEIDDEVTEVVFCYGNQTARFFTWIDIGQDIIKVDNEPYLALNFDLDTRARNYVEHTYRSSSTNKDDNQNQKVNKNKQSNRKMSKLQNFIEIDDDEDEVRHY